MQFLLGSWKLILLLVALLFGGRNPCHLLVSALAETAEPSDTGSRQEAARRMLEVLSPIANDPTIEEEYMAEDLSAIRRDMQLLFGEYLGKDFMQQHHQQEQDDYDDNDEIFYADRHAQKMLDIINDPDCMTGDIDASADDFSIERAVQVLSKCGLVVIRNALPQNILEAFKRDVTKYIFGLDSGRINPEGTTTYGEQYYIHEVLYCIACLYAKVCVN
jgi:hypothetical protein